MFPLYPVRTLQLTHGKRTNNAASGDIDYGLEIESNHETELSVKPLHWVKVLRTNVNVQAVHLSQAFENSICVVGRLHCFTFN